MQRYFRHFMLVEDPFSLTADPKYMFLSDSHAEALAALDIGITERRGLVAVVGEVGTGKTTLARHIMETMGYSIKLAFVSNTTLSFAEILREVLREFGIQPASNEKGDMIAAFEKFLRDTDAKGETAALLVDEAQNLSDEALEEFRLLLNLETPRNKLLQVVLLGQPELHEKLQTPSLRHVADRVAVRSFINPLSKEDCYAYIQHRLEQAGGHLGLFSEPALKKIAVASKGIPRRINVLCHLSLLFALGRDQSIVDKATAKQAIKAGKGEGLQRVRDRRLSPLILAGAITVSSAALALAAFFAFRGDSTADTPQTSAPARLAAAPAEALAPVPSAATQEPDTPDSATASPPEEPRPAPEEPAESTASQSQSTTASTMADDATIVQDESGDLLVRIERGITLHDLMLGVYGTYSPDLLERVLAVNAHIKDPTRIIPGQIIRLPNPESISTDAAPPEPES